MLRKAWAPVDTPQYSGTRNGTRTPLMLYSGHKSAMSRIAICSISAHVHAPLSDLYHAPGATPVDQAALALMWQATWGIFGAMLYVGFFVVPIGLILLGVRMLASPSFGRGFGWFSVVLGAIGLLAAVLKLIDPASMTGAGSYFACLIFYFVLGKSKVYRRPRSESLSKYL